jgi:hypothetical protein
VIKIFNQSCLAEGTISKQNGQESKEYFSHCMLVKFLKVSVSCNYTNADKGKQSVFINLNKGDFCYNLPNFANQILQGCPLLGQKNG